MAITASLVAELRQKTNAGMMECKKALTETNGDLAAAVKLLREKGIAKAASKADRDAKEGIVTQSIAADSRSGFMVEINCETDFVAKNDNFQGLVNNIAAALSNTAAADLDAALAASTGDSTVDELVKSKVLELGENLKVSNYARFEVPADAQGLVSSYIHLGGRVGALTLVLCEKADTLSNEAFQTMVKDLNLHIAFSKPQGLVREEIDGSLVEAEREVYAAQLRNEGKPEQIIDKIVEGKVNKFYSDIVLLEQTFVKDNNLTIAALLESVGKQVGDKISLAGFACFAIGA